MLHHTCDLCGRELLPDEERRYVVKIEVFASCESRDEYDDELDQDHLEEIAQLIDEVDDLDPADWDDGQYQNLRFDLCSDCRRKFLQNPLAREPQGRIGFSDN